MVDQTLSPEPALASASKPATAAHIGSFLWYELLSPDPDAAKTFYDAVVGWNIEASSSFPNGYRMINRSDGKPTAGILPLGEEMRQHGARPAWLGYIAVADADATAAAVTAAGGTALMPAFDIPNVGRVALLTDPEGAPFYIMQSASGEGSDAFSTDQAQHVRWNELSASDPDAAIAFYARHFGWAQEGDMDMGEMGKYRFLQANGVSFGAVMPRMPDMPASAWNYYVGVDDIDRATEAVRAGGGTLFHDPMEIPGGEFAVSGADPQGAMFGLVGPRK